MADKLFASKLSSNNNKVRIKAFKGLRNYLENRASCSRYFKDDKLVKMWKRLRYCLTMTDKLKIQEEMCSSLANLLICFQDIRHALLFAKAFYDVEMDQWDADDSLKKDVSLRLTHCFVREIFTLLHRYDWQEEAIVVLHSLLSDYAVTCLKKSLGGFPELFVDVYLHELATVDVVKLTMEQVSLLLRPFFHLLGDCNRFPSSVACVKLLGICSTMDDSFSGISQSSLQRIIFDKKKERSPKSASMTPTPTVKKRVSFGIPSIKEFCKHVSPKPSPLNLHDTPTKGLLKSNALTYSRKRSFIPKMRRLS